MLRIGALRDLPKPTKPDLTADRRSVTRARVRPSRFARVRGTTAPALTRYGRRRQPIRSGHRTEPKRDDDSGRARLMNPRRVSVPETDRLRDVRCTIVSPRAGLAAFVISPYDTPMASSRPPGRPRKGEDLRVQLPTPRVDPETYAWLKERGKHEGGVGRVLDLLVRNAKKAEQRAQRRAQPKAPPSH
jgi:hypothetical protein